MQEDILSQMNTIGYFYNLHVNTDSFLYSLMSVKKYSPGSPVILFTDESLYNWKDYKALSKILTIPFVLRDKPATFIDRQDSLETNLPKMQEFINRMYTACTMLDTQWVVRLEDDVHMRSPIRQYPTTMCAGNHQDFGMGGGSIMNREVFISIYENEGPKFITDNCIADNNKAWAADGLLRNMFETKGYSYSKWSEITEDWMENDKDAAFHHGDKTLYDKTYLKQRGL
jgi:hypothetical protein